MWLYDLLPQLLDSPTAARTEGSPDPGRVHSSTYLLQAVDKKAAGGAFGEIAPSLNSSLYSSLISGQAINSAAEEAGILVQLILPGIPGMPGNPGTGGAGVGWGGVGMQQVGPK